MSTDNNSVSLSILDKEYQVACPPDQQQELRNAAKALDTQMRQIRGSGKVVGLERIAVMAALNAVYDLQTKQPEAKTETGSPEQLKRLNNKVDGALQRLMQLEI